MTKKIIINADDFGISEGAVLGIIKAHQDGILTSTTCMVNMPYAKMGLELASRYPNLGVGIHLVLTVGHPLIDGAKSYVDKNGNFLRPSAYPNEEPNANFDELYREWKAQIERFIKLAGKKPTHIDSHHHVHLLPQHHDVVIKLAKEYDLPIRQRDQIINNYQYVRCNDQFYKDNVNYEELKIFPSVLQPVFHELGIRSLRRVNEHTAPHKVRQPARSIASCGAVSPKR